jgi:hypothetical protein
VCGCPGRSFCEFRWTGRGAADAYADGSDAFTTSMDAKGRLMKGPPPEEDDNLIFHALEANRLQVGEDPATDDPADVAHWIGVYGELLGYKAELLATARSALERLSEEVRPEARIDEVIMRRQAQRYQERMDFWQARAGQVRPPVG